MTEGFSEALTVGQALAVLRELPKGHDTKVRLRLTGPALGKDNPRQLVFGAVLPEMPGQPMGTAQDIAVLLSEGANMSPTMAADLTLRCFLWDKPLTRMLLVREIVGHGRGEMVAGEVGPGDA